MDIYVVYIPGILQSMEIRMLELLSVGVAGSINRLRVPVLLATGGHSTSGLRDKDEI